MKRPTHCNIESISTRKTRSRPLLSVRLIATLAVLTFAGSSYGQDDRIMVSDHDILVRNAPEFFMVTAPYGGAGLSLGDQDLFLYEGADGRNVWVQFGVCYNYTLGVWHMNVIKVLEETARQRLNSTVESIELRDMYSGTDYVITEWVYKGLGLKKYSFLVTNPHGGLDIVATGFSDLNAVSIR